MELAILMWFVIGAGIAAGAFVLVRSAMQIAGVAYAVLEKRLDPRLATRQTVLLTLVMLAALAATAVIAGVAIFTIFAELLQTGSDRLE